MIRTVHCFEWHATYKLLEGDSVITVGKKRTFKVFTPSLLKTIDVRTRNVRLQISAAFDNFYHTWNIQAVLPRLPMAEFIDLHKCDRVVSDFVILFNRFWRITVPFWSAYQSNARREDLGNWGSAVKGGRLLFLKRFYQVLLPSISYSKLQWAVWLSPELDGKVSRGVLLTIVFGKLR